MNLGPKSKYITEKKSLFSISARPIVIVEMSCGIWSIHPLTEKETIFCIYSSAFKICNSIYYLTVIVYNSPILSCLRFNDLNKGKGQLISKANCQAVNSSKKRTNEFVFTTMRRVFIRFWKKLKTPKRNHLTFREKEENCKTYIKSITKLFTWYT